MAESPFHSPLRVIIYMQYPGSFDIEKKHEKIIHKISILILNKIIMKTKVLKPVILIALVTFLFTAAQLPAK